jgi:hypothetical protein
MYLDNYNNTNFKSWELRGSNTSDFSTYTTIDTITNISWSSYPQTLSFTPSNNTNSFLYYRFFVTANQGSGDYVCVAEIELYGY